MTQTSSRLRRAGAGTAIGALVGSALLFAPSAQAADPTITNVREADIATSAASYPGWHQAVVGGERRVINEGLELTKNAEVVRGYTNFTGTDLAETNGNADIKTLGASKLSVVSGAAALKVDVFSEEIATADKLATLTLDAATGKWVSNVDIDADNVEKKVTATEPTDADKVIAAIGTKYRVKGFGVAGAAGTNVVKSITFDGTQYTFGNNAPVARNRTYTTKIDQAVAVNLAATDVDGNPLTYTAGVTSGSLSGTGETRTFTPAKGFKGAATVNYTVTDERGGTANGAITINVVKLKGSVDIYRVHPKKPSTRSTVYVYASIKTDGKAASKGSTIYLYVKSKRVAVGKVNSVGKVKLKLAKKLPYGKATIKIVQAGSSKLSGGTDSIAVRVRK